MVLELLVLLCLYLAWKVLKSQPYLQVRPGRAMELDPSRAVFAFDLHEVVVFPNTLRMVQLIVTTREGLQFVKSLLTHWKSLQLIAHILYEDFKEKKGVVVEEVFFKVGEINPGVLKQLEFFVKVSNTFDPEPTTLHVIKLLKERGYKLYLFSNIGSKFFQDMKTHYPWMDLYFDGFMCSSGEDNYLKKPNEDYYNLFVERFMKKDDRLVIFVDDKVSNLKGAVMSASGRLFHPLLFTSGPELLNTLKEWKAF